MHFPWLHGDVYVLVCVGRKNANVVTESLRDFESIYGDNLEDFLNTFLHYKRVVDMYDGIREGLSQKALADIKTSEIQYQAVPYDTDFVFSKSLGC